MLSIATKMADFLVPITIDSDGEGPSVNDTESDSEAEASLQKKNETKKRKKGQKEEQFNPNFEFEFKDSLNEHLLKVQRRVKDSVRGQVDPGNVEEKIKERRHHKKNKTEKKKNLVQDKIADEAKGAGQDNFASSEEDSGKDGDESDSEEKAKEKFFSKPPTQVLHEKFTQMNLSRPLLKAVNELGFLHPTPIQSATIPMALLGKDICACAATGTGKTAAFMLPILERLLFRPRQVSTTRVLILVPTRELAIQVHSVSVSLAKYTTVQICLAAGGMDSKGQEAALRKGPDVVIATPGRLVDHLLNAPSFDLQTVEILVLDEADRMLDEHFKDEMDEIIRLCPKGRQSMLFSATMTDEVEELAQLSLNQPVRLFVDQNTDVAANLHQEFVRIRSHREDDRLAIIAALVCRHFREQCLIFIQTKVFTHRLRIILGLLGVNVGELHGNLTQAQRFDALEKFKSGMTDVLIATDLAGRGLDIQGVKTVINMNMPAKLKSYIHRVGRTARAGKSGRAVTLVGEKERKLLKEIVKRSPLPVKNRIVPPEVINKYKQRIEEISKDVKEILKEEAEEKEIRISELEMNRARNLIEHREEIERRPPRVWIKKSKTDQDEKPSLKKTKKKASNENQEEAKLRKEQEFVKRQVKREKRPKRMRSHPDEVKENQSSGASSRKKIKMVPRQSKKSFDRELTDTSSKALKEFRSSTFMAGRSKGKRKSFNSKKRFKRR